MGILFRGAPTDPKTLAEVIGQGVGAASVCWENMEGTGIFNDAMAREIVNEMSDWINKNWVPLPESPLLGLATTMELIDELKARAEMQGYGKYKTYSEEI